MMKSFDIDFKGISYKIDVVEEDDDVEIFVERDKDEEDIPDNELLAIVEYLVHEGFVKPPAE